MEYIHDNGSILAVEIHGEGTPILCFHPPGMGRKVFYEQKPLSKDAKLIFPDLLGHGDSQGIIENWSIEDYADQGRIILDGLNIEKAVIFGYSAGGCIAQQFALTFPEKTEALILSGGYPEILSPILKYEHYIGMLIVKRFPKLLAKIISSSHTKDRFYREQLFQHMLKADVSTWLSFYEQSLTFSCVNRTEELECPILLIYGNKDFINQHMRTFERHTSFIPALIDGGGHQLPTKNSDELNAIIKKFIQNLPQ